MDALAALRLQSEWGADEALEIEPVDRLRPLAAPISVPTPPALVGPPAAVAGQAADLAANAATIADLRTAVEKFTGCALRDTATTLVFAEGDATGGLMLIGDAPGADDDRAGRPFSGPAGAYLDRMLASIGLDRANILLTPLIPWRPPGDRVPSPAELAACLPFLWRLIVLAGPRRVLLLGPVAARSLLPPNQRRRARGVWVDLVVPGAPPELAGVPALAGISPAALLRQPSQRRDAWADLRKLRRAMAENITNA